ncbi:Response regulator containing a CheY-like receiver domain and a GGDEF domain [Hahella chejuensis KCTC 2396]|uniref:diguanylate cyclase n=1 Tax=Hahella chejuensis (strain KCTC 2396) TaxID=349521 RepID=Q2S9K6_HAHCH|nr:diguanylate cyclase [Hahella chejuensis]ABC32668.1 Response regulator containing a CheY-like receiver domain and a GGDEF domain [Hahella chejuensis KCTC 2396]
MNERILLIEDSVMITKVLRHLIKTELGLPCDSAGTLQETREFLEKDPDGYFVTVVDLHLPDAPNGEVLDYVLSKKLPCIVLTATYDEGKRETILQKPIVDYVVKESRYSYEYVTRLIRRLLRNRNIKVVVADDSDTSRQYVRQLLVTHLYQVQLAKHGREALEMIKADPEIKMLISDYNMPEMDGFELTRALRREYDKKDLVIIGLSGYGSATLSAKFIKNGANDFLMKPFFHEEFHCRIMHNIEAMENIQALNDAANRDYLTGMYNRRYLFSAAKELYRVAKENGEPLTAAMIDVDHFKRINDTYGHEAGDRAICAFAKMIGETFGDYLAARFGGEEFCVLFPGVSIEKISPMLESFRHKVEQTAIPFLSDHLRLTVSIGATDVLGDSLDNLIRRADVLLYESKDNGRNRLTTDEDI